MVSTDRCNRYEQKLLWLWHIFKSVKGILVLLRESLVAQMVKDLPAMHENGVQFLGLIPGVGRSPGEENATYSRILAWKIPWREDPGGSPGVHGITKSWS